MIVKLSAGATARIQRIIRQVSAAAVKTPSCANVTPEQIAGLAIYMAVEWRETDLPDIVHASLVSYATSAMEAAS